LRDPDSYSELQGSSEGKRNNLLKSFKQAEKDHKLSQFKGPYWDQMVRILSKKETADSFGIVSDTAYDKDDWIQFFKYLKRKKYIKELPKFDLFHSLRRHDYDDLNLQGDISERTTMLLDQIGTALGRVPLGEEDVRLHPNGREFTETHTLVFVSADQKILDRVFTLAQSLTLSKRDPIKYVLINVGTKEEIIDSHRPAALVIEPGGTVRSAKPQEITGELFDVAKVFSKRRRQSQLDCRGELAKLR